MNWSNDHGSFHFIVLDCNYLKFKNEFVDYVNSNYFSHPESRGFVSDKQLRWLEQDLTKTTRQTLIFSHQCLEGEVRENVRTILERANE